MNRIIVAVLLSLFWLSLAPKLWPMPAERVTEIEGAQFEPLEWLPDEANSQLKEIASPPAWSIWAEWIRQLGLIALGLVGAGILLLGHRLALIVIAASSCAFLALWYYHHTTHILAGVIDTPQRTLMTVLFERWADATYLANHWDTPLPHIHFLYYEVLLPVVQMCVIVLSAYWWLAWGRDGGSSDVVSHSI